MHKSRPAVTVLQARLWSLHHISPQHQHSVVTGMMWIHALQHLQTQERVCCTSLMHSSCRCMQCN
jgi:hypothetical protein